MVYLADSENIYFDKTKEYFSEVLSSYASGNYRSAVVMLYSVAICDLLFKLKELCDMYDDSVAKGILLEVEKCRNTNDNKSKSRWEKELIENIHRKTELLDLEAYTNLNHLYDHRNFSAHPALNENYELISPSRESTIALIKNILTSILIKPPIFIKKVMDLMLEDIEEKRDIYTDEPEKLKEYLSRKYYSRMSDSMKKSTFRSLWKLCFCMPDDEKCSRNISINRKAMEALFEITPEILDFMKSDAMFEKLSPSKNCQRQLCILLAHYPQIYTTLSEDIKFQLSSTIDNDGTAKIISWFTSKDKHTHIEKIISEANYISIPEETIRFVEKQYKNEGLNEPFIDFCIEYFGASTTFAIADDRYRTAIRPYLEEMNQHQVILLISRINENDQIYNRNAAYSTNSEIIQTTRGLLEQDFNFENYPRFKFDREKAFPQEFDADDAYDAYDCPF